MVCLKTSFLYYATKYQKSHDQDKPRKTAEVTASL